ncbi:UNVERIFIED_CONTAM: hypothetical protein Slati_0892500 [Sesamum latifolium]|uniref:Reverse transcriptase domain-containing protein n=1 Tax=Sesamum latifolium TaxID=2727402 RepID=A0AAW2XN22_9LAMI
MLGILNLCFADDVLIFCARTVNSIRTIKATLAEFAEMSGLHVNPSKSTIILSKAVQGERQAILELMGFQEGSLPIKYLGVPLIASRLTVADCQPLIDRINSRLAGWNHLNLSLAGRTQPLGVGKKLVKISILLKEGLDYRVGDGSKFKLWTDLWHPRGPLIHSFPCGPTITGLPSNSLLMTVMQQGQWRWPSETDFDIQEIIAGLPPIFPQQSDLIKWRPNAGMFTTAAVLSLLQPASPRVHWHRLLGGKFKIPRHDFILWLAILERLSTIDRLWSVRFQWPNLGWQRDILWASRRWRGKHLLNAAARALLASNVYNIWREHNNRRFTATASSAETVAIRAMEEIRYRIISEDIRPSLQLSVLYRIWEIPWDRH